MGLCCKYLAVWLGKQRDYIRTCGPEMQMFPIFGKGLTMCDCVFHLLPIDLYDLIGGAFDRRSGSYGEICLGCMYMLS